MNTPAILLALLGVAIGVAMLPYQKREIPEVHPIVFVLLMIILWPWALMALVVIGVRNYIKAWK